MATDDAARDEPGVVRMPAVERRGSAMVLTCTHCGRFVPVVSETVEDTGYRELEYACPCGQTNVIVREVR